jgi:rsbT co-antagonist protein RsbR
MNVEGQSRRPDPEGIKDFWQLYERHYDEINAELMAIVEGLPQLAAALKRMSAAQLEEQSRLSRELLKRAVLDGEWAPLMDNQRRQGALYASLDVSFTEWFDIVVAFQRKFVPLMVAEYSKSPERLSRALVALNSYVDMGMSVIGDEYLKTKERIIGLQEESIRELSTPVLQIRERMLLVPIVGVLDTHRARLMTEGMLQAIRSHRARVVVIDITGVAAVDSKVANHLFQTVAAARLMGARAVITGLSSDVAQALVALGVDLEKLNTVGDLQGGLEEAERIMGLRLVKVDEPARGIAS